LVVSLDDDEEAEEDEDVLLDVVAEAMLEF
jgi:hypothetical protein